MFLRLACYVVCSSISISTAPGINVVAGVAAASPASASAPYFADWTLLGPGRPSQPTCVDIPKNMSLCHGIGYNKMRLPNLLDHDTMAEVSQQAGSWVPLFNVRCHPDTQLFLCSLFCPVCLDRPIYPCRSLCDRVKLGCEGRMKAYGFPWPEMFKCEKFPLDNDMCITPQSNVDSNNEDRCQVCNQVETYENILDNFCRADFAVRTKIRRARKTKLTCKKGKVLKGGGEMVRLLRRPVFNMQPPEACCEDKIRNTGDAYLIMGYRRDGKLIPSFIMPWGKHSKPFKRAVRMFKKLNCTDPKLVSHSVIGNAFSSTTPISTGGTLDGFSPSNNDRAKRGRSKGPLGAKGVKGTKGVKGAKGGKERKSGSSTTTTAAATAPWHPGPSGQPPTHQRIRMHAP